MTELEKKLLALFSYLTPEAKALILAKIVELAGNIPAKRRKSDRE